MPSYLAFLRAVNVGGRSMPMARAREVLTTAGFEDVATYIQSGNVLVTIASRTAIAKVENRIGSVLSDEFGFDVPVIVRTPAQLLAISDYLERAKDPFTDVRARYVYLLPAPLSAAGRTFLKDVGERVTGAEHVEGVGSELYLWLSGPMHESVLPKKLGTASSSRTLGASTARNATVMLALAARWGGSGPS